MGKSKRIAIGGWLSNALSIMTRGWFGLVLARILGDNAAFIPYRDNRAIVAFRDNRAVAEFGDGRAMTAFEDGRAAAAFRDNRVYIRGN